MVAQCFPQLLTMKWLSTMTPHCYGRGIFWGDCFQRDISLKNSGLKYVQPITTKFCTCHDSYTVVTFAKFHCDWLNILWTESLQILLNFEFDCNIISGGCVPGPWFNVEMLSFQYRKHHCTNKMVIRIYICIKMNPCFRWNWFKSFLCKMFWFWFYMN